ncbi:hypothetical protein CALVIDRAFT_601658 [Calocera viscosa TUFC12733]|uniref:Fork-head domain-containing protein n=1 Tax=Calocera viscosa (strain TUFC12733) TaxID=1330018 RepID=A0A167HZD1_CALVF|nr:hypothetical protein CALVIDRAFT_601658 [Calocera viscosa TUFC12733]
MSQPPIPPVHPQQIRAYYKLEFPGAGHGQGRDYYFQTLSITIGRRPLPPAPRSPSTSAEPAQPHQPSVDVHLGALKSVSRLHAKIEYDEAIGSFVFAVHGRNGAWVDDVWIAKGGRVPLHQKTKLQIANRTFYFHLPPGSGPDLEQKDFPLPGSTPVDVTSVTPPADSPSPSPTRSSASPMLDIKEDEESEASSLFPPVPGSGPPSQKPPYTYAQLCYRALRDMGGRATLQDIIDWMMRTFDWYRQHPNSGWQTSIRHTLSMNNAFIKSPKSQGERGKGCNWTLHPNAYQLFEATSAKTSRHHPYQPPDGHALNVQLTHGAGSAPAINYLPPSGSSLYPLTPFTPPSYPTAITPTPNSVGTGPFNLPSNVSLPIVIAPLPATANPPSANPHLDAPPIVLDAGRLVLNPTIFAHLTQEQLSELQQLGAQQALKILQEYIVVYLKERMRGEKAGPGKPKGKKKKGKKEGKMDSMGPDSAAGEGDTSHPISALQSGPPAVQTIAGLLANPPPPSASPILSMDPDPQLGTSGEGLSALAEAATSHAGE